MKTILKRITKPASLITLDEAKEQSRIDGSDDDDTLSALIDAVSDTLDGPKSKLGRAVMLQGWSFSRCMPTGRQLVSFPVVPLISIDAIQYVGEDGETATIESSEYCAYDLDHSVAIEPVTGWPSGSHRIDAFTITATCGCAEDDVPAKIKQAARLLCAHWYENREASTERAQHAIPFGVQCLLDVHRNGWVEA